MANYERDKDDVRVYDGSEDDDDGEGSHLPVVIIIAILVLAAFGGVVWLAYNQGVARGRNEPVRMASAESSDPGNGGQIKVYQQPAGSEEEDEAQQAAAKPADAPPPQAATRTEPPPPAQPPAQAVAQVSPPPAAKPQVQTPPPPPKQQVAQVTPKPQTPPAAKPQPQPAAVATKPPAQLGVAHPAAETPKPVAVAPPPKPVVTAAKPATVKPAASGSYLLQIGAYKSEAEAMNAWKIYSSKHGALLAGFGPDVQRADLGDKGTWYRLRISSFADKDGATALCERLKAQNGACFLAR